MSEEVDLGYLRIEGAHGKRKLEPNEELSKMYKIVGLLLEESSVEDVKMDCTSKASASVECKSSGPVQLGLQASNDVSSMEVACQPNGGLSRIEQLENVKWAKICEEINSTRSNLHEMWMEMGYDANTVSGLEEKLRGHLEGVLESVRNESMWARFYNGNGVRVHPLLVDNILDKIFEYVYQDSGSKGRGKDAKAEIKNARLVCKTWNDRATALMRRTGPAIVFGNSSFGLDNGEIRLATITDVQRFLEVMRGSTMMPFQEYYLSGRILSITHSKLLKDFLQVISPAVMDLGIYVCWDESRSRYRHFQSFMQNLGLLKLRKLEIKIKEIVCSTDWQGVTHFMKQLLKSAPQLRELNLLRKESPPSQKFENENQFKLPTPATLKLIPNTVKKLSICSDELTDLHFEAFAGANLELKELTLSCRELECTATCVGNFFEKQSATLIGLELSEKAVRLLSSGIPQLRKIEHLTVKEATDICLSLFIADKFPSVRKLEIYHLLSDSEKPVGCIRATTSVEELCLREVNLASDQQIKNVKECFPKVKILTVWFSSNIMHNRMESIFTHFSQVEELYVKSKHHHYRSDIEGSGGIYRSKPSLLNLTKLRKLGLWNARSGQVSDLIASDDLLLKMPNLEELTLERSNMSSVVVEKLQQKLKKIKLGTTD